jgi:glycosyltransferase involved in cell wall biosynthesis
LTASARLSWRRPTRGASPVTNRAPPPIAAETVVVHVVGVVTDEVFSFLGPATRVLALKGLKQAIVMIDDERFRYHNEQLADASQLILAPKRQNPWAQWRAVKRLCREVLQREPLQAVHLHGILPGFAGAWALRRVRCEAPVYFSPHASRSLSWNRWIGSVALRLFRGMLGAARSSAIINISDDTPAFNGWQSTDVVESPVSDAYFNVVRNEAPQPLIVTGGRIQSTRNEELFAQLAVLLGGTDLGIVFHWIGSIAPQSRRRLAAANVIAFDLTSDLECASRLALGWLYVAPGATRGFPLFLIEAMASGLPCVVLDCPQHRVLIRDGVTGFLCATEREMLNRIAELVDSQSLRESIGATARMEVRRRFSTSQFDAKLLAAYDFQKSAVVGDY